MNAGKESEIRLSVRGAITKLATGNVFTLADLFGKLPDRSADCGRARTILKRLVAGGIINASEYGGPGEPKIYQAKNVAELKRIETDEFELSRLIWPGRTPPRPTSPELANALKTLMEPDEPAEPTPPAPVQPVAEQSPEQSPEILPTILKLLGAAIENIIYMREKIDRLDAKVSALDSVACSHCGHPEAHRAPIE
jgi:hypothetical protein